MKRTKVGLAGAVSLSMAGLCGGQLLHAAGAEDKIPRGEWQRVVAAPHTERLDLPAGGVLHLRNSTGEVTVEGWDRADVEIATYKSTKETYSPKDKAKVLAELDKVKVSAAVKGEELLVTTEFPRRLSLPGISPLHGAATTFNLEYRIKAPRNARVVVEHNEGEVHIEDIAGDIRVKDHQGEITLHLAGEGPRSISASSTAGGVTSDFPGRETRRGWFLGHSFAEAGQQAGQKIDLRIGYGDIVILKMREPRLPEQP